MPKKRDNLLVPLAMVGKLYDQMVKVVRHSEKDKEQNIILYVGHVYHHMLDAINAYEKKEKKKFRIAVLNDSKQKLNDAALAALDRVDIVLTCDTTSVSALQKTLAPFQDELLAVTCRSEGQIPVLARVIPHTPYVATPTTESLLWSSDKILMRERLVAHNKHLTPAFTIIKDKSKATIKKIEEQVQYPLVVKPSGLASSILVTICFHRDELEAALKKVFKKIESITKEKGFVNEPKVLVEHFIEGEQYSIDAYVDARGRMTFCPMVNIKTGKSIGFDDFFGYRQMTPTLLNKESIALAEVTAAEAIRALALRSTSVHIEMFKTEQGWQIIEMGARVGGFRHMLYDHSYGINHTVNDILNHTGKKVTVPKHVNGFSVAMKFYAKKEGKLKKLGGIKKIQELKSFKKIYINKKIGDSCLFAKHGGNSVFNVILFNKDRSKLLADIRRLEQTVAIETD